MISTKANGRRQRSIVILPLLLLAALFLMPAMQNISYAQNNTQQTITQIATQAAEAVPGSDLG